MQPRTLEQILAELNPVTQPQVDLLRTRQAGIGAEVDAEEKGLRAQEQDFFDNTLMADARRRGVGFSGIPEGERARYGASQFLPAIAKARSAGKERAFSLEEAILGIKERATQNAMSIRQYEQERYDRWLAEEEAKKRAAAEAAAQNSWMSAFAKTGGGTNTATDKRPSLDSIFGVGGSPQALRVAQPRTQGNILQGAGGLSIQNPVIPQGTFNGLLQGAGTVPARLNVPQAPKSSVTVNTSSTPRRVVVR